MRALRARSGIDALLDRLHRHFLDLADPLRARHALHALEAASWLGTTPAETAALTQLRGNLDPIRGWARMRQLDLAAALADVNAGRWQATPKITAELVALATGPDLPAQLGVDPAATPDQIRTLLSTRVATWRTLEHTSPTKLAARHARTVHEHLGSLYFTPPT